MTYVVMSVYKELVWMQIAWLYPISKHRNSYISIWRANFARLDTRDVGLSNNMARSMKLTCCVLNKVFLENHFHDIINSSYKWLYLCNTYRCIGPST